MEFSEIRQMMGFLENGAVLPPSPRRGDDWDTDDTEDDFSRFSDSCIYDPVDWRDYGYVTRVKNQRDCGSSWAFSATGSLEGQMKRRTGRPVSLSEQNLIDCSWAQGNRGCDGGSMRKAFDYIKSNGGISVEKCYSYDAKNGTCRYNPRCSGGTVRGYVSIKKGSERALTKAISHIGPISVGIRVPESFYRYKSGVYEDSSCNNASDHHAVLAVGYGITRGEAYYTLKNSWGVHWGEHGYIYMARNQRNMCGIADAAVYPIV